MDDKIKITVKAFGGLRANTDLFPIQLELPANARLQDLISAIAEINPQLHSELARGLSQGYINILVDGRNARFLDGLETELQDRASVAFIPPVGGG